MLSLKNLSNPEAVVIKLLRYSAVPTTFNIADELEKHPDYPSLLSISDILTHLKIENRAFRLSFDELADVPCPFIAHTNLNGGDFLLVTKAKNGNFFVENEKWSRHKLTAEAFKKMYSGVILTFEPSAFSNSTTIAGALTNLKTPALATCLLLILVSALVFHTSYFSNLSWQIVLLTLAKTAGLITSVLLLIQSIDSNNPLIQVLCQSGGKTDCNAILSSKAAKVPINIGIEGLTWSEVGFFYFAGTWLLLLFGGRSPATYHALALLNFISLPYTVYSIYYQARVAQKWCLLCCTIQALLWFEFVPLFSMFLKYFVSGEFWQGLSTSTLFICLITPIVLWILLKPLLLKAQQLQPLKQQLRKFKYNTELFNKLLNEQPKYVQPDEEWSIVLGNATSNNVITMITNPYCPPCSNAHKLLDELIGQKEDIQARIVFANLNMQNDRDILISRHLMALNELPDKTTVKQALHDWYDQKQKNYEAWAKAYPVNLNGSENDKIEKQKDWNQMAEINATPTLLLNGRRLPTLYLLPDLKYMLE